MNDLEATAVGVVILVLMLIFVGIWFWAWLPYHKKNFDSLARLPMLDLSPPSGSRQSNAALVTAHEGGASDEGKP
jgi:cytochrome c oxidase cbb3-type subunit 4